MTNGNLESAKFDGSWLGQRGPERKRNVTISFFNRTRPDEVA